MIIVGGQVSRSRVDSRVAHVGLPIIGIKLSSRAPIGKAKHED